MADSKYLSTQETTNLARIVRVILGPCSDILRDVLEKEISAENLSSKVKLFIAGLPKKTKRPISKEQELLVYGEDYKKFDVSLLYFLLRNMCSISSCTHQWGKEPNPCDKSLSANIERIRLIRNEYYGHFTDFLLPNEVFEQKWKKISQIIIELERDLGSGTRYQESMAEIKICHMDPEKEKESIKKLLTVKTLQRDVSNLKVKVKEIEKSIDPLLNKEDPAKENEELLAMVKAIFSQHKAKTTSMDIREFDEKFKKIYKKDFKTMSKLKISDFVEKNNRILEIWTDKHQRKKIKLKFKKMSTKGKRKTNTVSLLDQTNKAEDSEDSDSINTESACQITENDGEALQDKLLENAYLESNKGKHNLKVSENLFDSDDDETPESKWTEVRRHKIRSPASDNTTKIQPQVPKQKQQEINEIPQRSNSEDKHYCLLEALLKRSDSHDFIFKQSEEDYTNHKYKLAIDLVSMWNRTGQTISYIVVRLDQSRNLPLLSEYLSLDNFTALPHFQYFEVDHTDAYYGIFELQSSHGSGQPAITKSSLICPKTAAVVWESNQLWFRENDYPIPLSLSDPLLKKIYKWFAGDDSASNTKPDTETRNDKDFNDDDMIHSGLTMGFPKTPLEMFRKSIRNFRKGKYVLLAGNMHTTINNLEAISTVPWMYVFDFDKTSRDSGLLSANENFIRKRRSLHLTNWQQPPAGITENGTTWTFLCGRRDNPESILQNCNDVRSWLQKVKGNMDLHIEQIQKYIEDYTVLTVMMIWPLDEQLAQHMHRFLIRLDENLDPQPNIVLCIPGQPSTKIGNSILDVLKGGFGENLTIIEVEMKCLFSCICDITKNQQNVSTIRYSLPTADEVGDPSIEDSDAAWLREELDMLYLSNPYTKCEQDIHSLEEEGDIFFRGGSLRWFAWYEVGAGHFDAERDLMSAITNEIKLIVKENRSAIVTLHHAPGSGGTTLAQRILWDFHKDIPCAHAKLRSALPISSRIERIETVYAKTHKPVLLLIDGDEDAKVNELIRALKLNSRCYIIILYVKRCPYFAKSKKFFLKGTVSIREAKQLALKFKNQCKEDEQKQIQLNELCEDVEKGQMHQVYEFGLATYLHEYKGIRKYVKGYLMPSGENVDCSIGRNILCFLSLAYYYGQIALPLQFFCGLIHKPNNYLVELEDLPEPVPQFVVFDENESKTSNIRVCHYLIAQEILEQVLGDGSEQRSTTLSLSAKRKLREKCEQFIEYASRKSNKDGNIVYTLTKIFIIRDKDMDEINDDKQVYSKLISDIYSEPPLFTERLQVLKKLTESFPNDQNFHAHLGRFYSNRRPSEDDEAEKCLQRATAICEKLIGNRPKEDLDFKLRRSLMHVYHIYGTILKNRIAKYTGKSPTTEPEIKPNFDDFDKRLDELISTAELSCEYFQKCRFYTPEAYNSGISFVGEIYVRLQVCDFIERQRKRVGKSLGITDYLSSKEEQYSVGRNFVKMSVYSIDNLIMDCLPSLEDEKQISKTMKFLVYWYNILFKKNATDLEKLAKGDDIQDYRLQIVAKKLKYSHGEGNLMMLENICEKEDIFSIVTLYEKIFRENVSDSQPALERDYKEWIFAIRHRLFDSVYSVEKVLRQVRKWHDVRHSPMSKFYLFILTSRLGFGEGNTGGSSEFLSEAIVLKKELERVSSYVWKPKYPREWLRKKGEGIKFLEPGTRFFRSSFIDDRNFKEDIDQTLRICKGTICTPNDKRLSGYISLDLGNNVVPVKVFYIPNKANLEGTAYAERRVEFILGFSLHHGWDAFNVRLLEKYPCPERGCNAHVEVGSTDEKVKCPGCQKIIFRHHFDLKRK